MSNGKCLLSSQISSKKAIKLKCIRHTKLQVLFDDYLLEFGFLLNFVKIKIVRFFLKGLQFFLKRQFYQKYPCEISRKCSKCAESIFLLFAHQHCRLTILFCGLTMGRMLLY